MKCAAIGILSCVALAQGAPTPKSLCELITHADRHMGKRVVVQGDIQRLEHGTYLVSPKKCEGEHSWILIQDIDWAAHSAAGGSGGVRVPATVEGELIMSRLGVPEFIKTPYLALSAKRVQYRKSQPKSKSPARP